jgi:hypothetical protein
MVVFFRKKYRPPLPPDPEKNPPDHDRVRIFHGLDSESAIIEVRTDGPPDPGPHGPDAAEHGITRIHDSGPVSFSPAFVFVAERHSLFFQQRLQSSHPAWHLEMLLQCIALRVAIPVSL